MRVQTTAPHHEGAATAPPPGRVSKTGNIIT
jgi:hypothetical protein